MRDSVLTSIMMSEYHDRDSDVRGVSTVRIPDSNGLEVIIMMNRLTLAESGPDSDSGSGAQIMIRGSLWRPGRARVPAAALIKDPTRSLSVTVVPTSSRIQAQ